MKAGSPQRPRSVNVTIAVASRPFIIGSLCRGWQILRPMAMPAGWLNGVAASVQDRMKNAMKKPRGRTIDHMT